MSQDREFKAEIPVSESAKNKSLRERRPRLKRIWLIVR
jgi:hypothetical protein